MSSSALPRYLSPAEPCKRSQQPWQRTATVVVSFFAVLAWYATGPGSSLLASRRPPSIFYAPKAWCLTCSLPSPAFRLPAQSPRAPMALLGLCGRGCHHPGEPATHSPHLHSL
jgi:hypothetical protein